MRTVPLTGKHARGRVALVDDSDHALVMQHRWNVQEAVRRPGRKPEGPYARTKTRLGDGRTGALFMHTLITGWALVDHRDGNGLNNQRSNLRPATNGQNQANAPSRSGSSSRFKGVSWKKERNRWVANIKVDGRARFLGYYGNEEDAARAYDIAAREAWGEYARPNFQSPPSRGKCAPVLARARNAKDP